MSVLFHSRCFFERGLRRALLVSLALHGLVIASVAFTPFLLAQRSHSPLAVRLAAAAPGARQPADQGAARTALTAQQGQGVPALQVPRKQEPARPQKEALPAAGGDETTPALSAAALRPAPEAPIPANVAPSVPAPTGLDAGALRGVRVGLAQALLLDAPPSFAGAQRAVAHVVFAAGGRLQTVYIHMETENPAFARWLSQTLTQAAMRTEVPAALREAPFEVELPVEWDE